MPLTSPDDLYGLALDRFIPERATLVTTLKRAGERDEAARVAALRKPSVAAWAVNQLVRTQTEQMEALFGAGDDLAAAQERAVAGEPTADAIRDATRRQHDALQQLARAADGLLDFHGDALSPTTLNQVAETLRAAGLDESARRQVQSGCLTKELAFAGLGMGDWSGPPPAAPPPATPSPPAPDPAEAALKAARSAERHARRTAAQAEKKLEVAQTRYDTIAAQLSDAQALLATAQEYSENTNAELRSAEAAVRQLGDGQP